MKRQSYKQRVGGEKSQARGREKWRGREIEKEEERRT